MSGLGEATHSVLVFDGARDADGVLGPANPSTCSDGFTIAPPSKGARGWYAFAQGTLDDLDRLPRIKGLAVTGEAPAATPNKPERIAIAKGQRNRELLRFCMTEARSCASLDELLDRATAFAETALSPVPEPVTAEEIKRTAMSAWGYEERGENWSGKRRVVAFDHDLVDRYLRSDPGGRGPADTPVYAWGTPGCPAAQGGFEKTDR